MIMEENEKFNKEIERISMMMKLVALSVVEISDLCEAEEVLGLMRVVRAIETSDNLLVAMKRTDKTES